MTSPLVFQTRTDEQKDHEKTGELDNLTDVVRVRELFDATWNLATEKSLFRTTIAWISCAARASPDLRFANSGYKRFIRRGVTAATR